MSHFTHKFIAFINDIGFILSKDYPRFNRKGLFLTYMRIRIKASLNRWFNFKTEHFLSYTVEVPDYNIFLAEFRQIFVRQTYYSDTAAVVPHIIDCGGNIGISVLYWKHLFPQAHITVFEPSQEVIGVLRKNIELNALTDVRVVEAAVSSEPGTAKIYIRGSKAEGNTLLKDIWSVTPTKGNRVFYEVQTVKLSDFITEPVDILKLDIEGNEGVVLKELVDAGKLHSVKECIMEYHYYPMVADNRLTDILSYLRVNGFEAQLYFEEHANNTQLELIRNGSYTFNIRTVPASMLRNREASVTHAIQA